MEELRTCRKCSKVKPLSAFVPREHRCRDCKSLYMADWGRRNRDKKNAANLKWLEANRKKAYAIYEDYARRHPEVRRSIEQKRRAAKANATVEDVGGKFVSILMSILGEECLYPDCLSREVTLDHVIPLSKGGSHKMENFQLLCKPHNSQKHTKDWDFRTSEQVSALQSILN